MSKKGLILDSVQCMRDQRLLFRPINVELAPGEVLMIRGINGAGKTTLLHTLCGFIALARGRVVLDGYDLIKDRDSFQDMIDYCGHRYGMKAAMSARENLLFLAQLYERDVTSIEQALAAFHLAPIADIPLSRCSAGQKNRVALAHLALKPTSKLWLLDEPISALDETAVESLLQLIMEHRKNGGIIILTSHLPIALKNMRTLTLSPIAPLIANLHEHYELMST